MLKMSSAKFHITRAGPLVSIQDLGRNGHMRFGVPKSGPMDVFSFKTANAVLGNEHTSSCIEVSIGGLELKCIEGPVSLCVFGGEFNLTVDDQRIKMGEVFEIQKDQRLSIRAEKSGSWCYLAFAGALVADKWLGSNATHFLSGFGGGVLKSDQGLAVENAKVVEPLFGNKTAVQDKFDGYIRVTLGPQDHHFTSEAVRLLLNQEFKVSTAYDRMGMRLSGPALEINSSLSIPSEPLMKGSVQVAGDGIPTILLSDHQTTGGYPKIATVISSDLDMLAQLRPNQTLRFKAVSPENAIRIARVKMIERA
jgi:biotin-dependent carboxylase-like uncharacterized protein